MATTTTTEKNEKEGQALFDGLVKKAQSAKVGEVVVQKSGAYARLRGDGRTFAYIVRGKTKVNVYPGVLAKDMPKSVKFRKVELGSHHYGRGEVIVPVESENSFENAIAALQAAAKVPPVAGKRGAKKPTEEPTENATAAAETVEAAASS